MMIKLLTVGALALGLGLTVHAAETDAAKLPPASDKKGVTYVADIKPILEKSCVKCHSGEKPKGHLKLDALEGVLKGGKNGKIVKSGDSAGSWLIKAVAHATDDEDDYMPPLQNKAHIGPLKPEEIGLIRAWIDQGAK
jgi:Planctomycete cytochrome C